jgi:two-component system response regulator FixJ
MTFGGTPERHIYIVDDDAAFCRSVERLLRSAGLAGVSFHSGSRSSKRPDLVDGCVIIDVRMPGMGGLELQKQLQSRGFKLPIIVMTLRGGTETVVRVMKAGAVDFIEKPFNDEGLLDAINAASAPPRRPPHDRGSIEAAKRIARLSPRERQALDGLVAGRMTKQIAHDLGISARTVEEHRARMLTRLGTRSPAEAVRLAVLAELAPSDLEGHAAHRQLHGGILRR